jgi:anti-sigma B factor antagonist
MQAVWADPAAAHYACRMATVDDTSVRLTVVREDGPEVSVLTLEGELDLSTAPRLSDRIDEVVGDGRFRILVDLAAVTFCDSTGMSAFVRGHYLCADGGGWLRLVGARGTVARVLQISGLDTLLGSPAD